MSGDGKRVELVDEGESSNATAYIGLGLIASLIIGFSPLLDAIQGNGPFENAMLRFLACVAVSVTAAAVIGRILDSAPSRAPSRAPTRAAQVASAGGDDGGPARDAGSSPESALKSDELADGTG